MEGHLREGVSWLRLHTDLGVEQILWDPLSRRLTATALAQADPDNPPPSSPSYSKQPWRVSLDHGAFPGAASALPSVFI